MIESGVVSRPGLVYVEKIALVRLWRPEMKPLEEIPRARRKIIEGAIDDEINYAFDDAFQLRAASETVSGQCECTCFASGAVPLPVPRKKRLSEGLRAFGEAVEQVLGWGGLGFLPGDFADIAPAFIGLALARVLDGYRVPVAVGAPARGRPNNARGRLCLQRWRRVRV
jgi:hypothetical protein